MSDDQEVVCEDSSSNTSSLESFENVSAAEMCKSSSQVMTDNDDAPDNKAIDVDSIGNVADQFYTSVHSGRAISNLVKFSAAMFVLPLLVMFTTYHYIFRDHYHLPPDEAMLYAGYCGIAVVIIIAVVFIYVAYREEQEDEKMKLSSKKSE
uniref:VMA21-like domain protein n=1 Tax=Angiostrongylus cantonensis TaxID=6313 RepID=A0A0K0CV04_ANGCA